MEKRSIPEEYIPCLRAYRHQLELAYDDLISGDSSEAARKLVRLREALKDGRYALSAQDLKGTGVIDIISELIRVEDDIIQKSSGVKTNIEKRILELDVMIGAE